MNKKILLVGGGTGGHIYPLLEVIKELKKELLEAELLLLGDSKMAEILVKENIGVDFKKISAGKWRRYFSLKNLADFFKIAAGVFQTLYIIYRFRPDVIFSKGGYVSLPIILANRILKKPLIIHESDATMGATNRFAAPFAQKICVGFPLENYTDIGEKPWRKMVYTGVPVSEDFYKPDVHRVSVQKGRPLILALGGSQGSYLVNQTVSAAAEELTKKYDLVLVCGEKNYEDLKSRGRAAAGAGAGFKVFATLPNEEIAQYLCSADLVISRAGASALFEIAAAKKPSILIPLESAAGDHQLANAKIFEKANASVLISEKNLTSENLIALCDNILSDKEAQKMMSIASSGLANRESAKGIVAEIKKLI